MQCQQCGQEVANEAAFCSRCGQQLRVRCRDCNTVNSLGSRFCFNCGRELVEGPGEAVAGGPGVQPAPRAVGCPRCYAGNEPGSTYCFRCGLPLEGEVPAGARRFSGIPAFDTGEPGGFWMRLLASIIDGLILGAFLLIVSVLLFGESLADYFGQEEYNASDLFDFAVNALYYTVTVALWATTVGKRSLRLYVVRRDGSKVGAGRAFARYLAYGLSAITLGVGFLMIGLRGDKRGLHDLVCDTVVVRRGA